MRGHLKNRDGNYTIVIYHGKDPITDKKKYTWHSCNQMLGRKVGKKEAETLLTEMLKEVADDKFIVPEKTTFREYLQDHWLPHIQNTVRLNTYRTYEMMVRNHLVPNLGGLQLSKIKPISLQRLYNSLLKDGSRKDGKEGALSPRSVQYVHTTAHRALGQAMVWQMINTNPADAVELPKQSKREMHVWESHHIKTFLDNVKDHRWFALYDLAFATGMRQSELLALRWQDIDLDKGIVAVRQSMMYSKGEFIFHEPKSKRSKRTITIPQGTLKTLRAHDTKQKAAYEKAKNKKPYDEYPDLVFRSRAATPISQRNLSRHFAEAQTKIELPPLTFHEIRHTHATLLLKADVHVKVVSERLGHASVAITLDTYSHVLPNIQQSAADKIEEALYPEAQEKKKNKKKKYILTKNIGFAKD